MNEKKKSKVDQKIADALDVENENYKLQETKSTEITKVDDDAQCDYETVRKNLHDIIGKGNGAIDGILEVAQEGDQPRAYEVAAQMIKTVSDANKDLVELHKKMKDIRKDISGPSSVSQTNAIYVGSTKELQELVNQSRSAARRLHNNNDIIDVEIDDGKN